LIGRIASPFRFGKYHRFQWYRRSFNWRIPAVYPVRWGFRYNSSREFWFVLYHVADEVSNK